MGTHLQYDDDYEEEVSLSDGSTALLRTIRPHDKALLRRGFERLSSKSRYLRFFTHKARLSDSDLRYLTEIDGFDHFALVAVRLDPVGRQEAIAVGRVIRLENEPEVAEPAIVVIDDEQGKGLGKLLLSRLAASARERGVRRFHAEFLNENNQMRHLFEALVKDEPDGLHLEHEMGVVLADMPVPEIRRVDGAPKISRRSAVRRLLSQAAIGAVAQRFRRLFRGPSPSTPLAGRGG